ncbi:DUF2306 domain-containing protein [Amycolatopsis sp. PS_44_ISF1]|uniref:DUF2306 domain-containing protein n=1 Tax=Amycolatopsis sp. PS_44_ISF1 TaxID=2974917 RepID=UPI0028DD66CC|nr:DUF2306 domain-containing protein [Amycolatopsis sp. PS_44_ISF1]MDT8911246.1 DUF2306 domain-containing protein [Amycolatopsis sp. PS_44_ISF1]
MTAGTDLRPPRVGPPRARTPERAWWRRPWIGPLGLVVVAFFAYSLPPYLALDPARSRVPAPEGFAAHYWFLVAHVLFGSIAMLGALVQVWPWVRRRYPGVHRFAGRAYVFGGVLPSGLMALTIGADSPFGPATRASDVLLAVLWLGVTGAGWRAARERRFGDHRRWMVRSFALTMSIILNRIISAVGVIVLEPQIATTFGGSEVAFTQSVAAIASWVSWTVALIGAQLWLDRRPASPRARPEKARPEALDAR